MSDDIPDNRSIGGAIALFVAIVVLILWDLIQDYSEGANWVHLGVELLVLLTAIVGIVFLWQKLTRTTTDLAEALVEAEKWRHESRELIPVT